MRWIDYEKSENYKAGYSKLLLLSIRVPGYALVLMVPWMESRMTRKIYETFIGSKSIMIW